MQFTPRHSGTRWCLVGDISDPVIAFAINELQRALQHRLPYVLEVRSQISEDECASRHLALVGLASDPWLRAVMKRHRIAKPSDQEALP